MENAWWSIALQVGTEWFKQLDDGNLLVTAATGTAARAADTDLSSSAAFAARLEEAMEQMLPLVKRSDRKLLYGHRKLCALYGSSTDEEADGSVDKERAFVELFTALYRCVKLVVFLAAEGSRRVAVRQLVRERIASLQPSDCTEQKQSRGHSRNVSIDTQIFRVDSVQRKASCAAAAGPFDMEQLGLPLEVPLKLSCEFVPPLTRAERCAIKKLEELCSLVRELLSTSADTANTCDLVHSTTA